MKPAANRRGPRSADRVLRLADDSYESAPVARDSGAVVPSARQVAMLAVHGMRDRADRQPGTEIGARGLSSADRAPDC